MAPPQKSSRVKSKKPYPTFPLTPHANGQWCKKIRGKVHFFGVWIDPRAAQEEYNRQAADLHAGRQPVPRAGVGEPTVKDLGRRDARPARHYRIMGHDIPGLSGIYVEEISRSEPDCHILLAVDRTGCLAEPGPHVSVAMRF